MMAWIRFLFARRQVRRRLARLVLDEGPADKPLLVPERCPVCDRRISGSVHRMQSLGPCGVETLLVCGVCKAFGPLESLITAAE